MLQSEFANLAKDAGLQKMQAHVTLGRVSYREGLESHTKPLTDEDLARRSLSHWLEVRQSLEKSHLNIKGLREVPEKSDSWNVGRTHL